jgi:hypothetical protein
MLALPFAGTRIMKRLSMWVRVLCALIAYSLAGCAGIATETPLRSGSHPLAEHQSVALSPTVRVRYDSFADSRCPKAAMCIWAGKVSYNFTLTSGAGNESFALDYEGAQYASKTLPGVSFGISFAGVRERPIAEHAVVLEVTAAPAGR